MEEAPHSCQARRHPAGSRALLCQAQPLVRRRRLLGAVGGNTDAVTLAQAGSEGEREAGTHAEAPSAPHFRACAWRRCETWGRRWTWEAEGAWSDWGWGTGPGERTAHLSRGQVGRRCELGLWPRLCTHRRGQPHSSPAPHTAVPGVNSWPSHTGLSIHRTGLALPTPNLCYFPEPSSGLPGPGEGTRHCWGTAAPARGRPNLNGTRAVARVALPAEPQCASLGDRGAFGCTL